MLNKIKRALHARIQLRGVKKGKNNNVFGRITVINKKNFIIGDNCTFNHDVYINAINPVKLGNDVTLSAGAKLLSSGIDYNKWANGAKCHIKNKTIEIGDHVWIGANAVILSDVKISGKYVVVAAGAIVTKNITENNVIVGGCPAKIIKHF